MSTETKAKPTPEQSRASHAWTVVQTIVKEHCKRENGKIVPGETARKFGGQAKKLPMRIMASGLGQALAFLRAKDYAPALLIALGDWVLDKRANPESKKSPPDDKLLLSQIVTGNSEFLRRATDEALAYLQWLNRFAEAENLTGGE